MWESLGRPQSAKGAKAWSTANPSTFCPHPDLFVRGLSTKICQDSNTAEKVWLDGRYNRESLG